MKQPRTPAPEEIPKELREAKIWCAWSAGESDRKAPLGARGEHVDVQNSNPGLTLKQALSTAKKVRGGIGLCLFGTSLAAVDGDCAYDEEGKIRDWAKSIMSSALACSLYVETSPSGNGFHVIGLAPSGAKIGRTNTRRPGARKEGVETFCRRGYLTITGDSLLLPPEKLGSANAAIKAAGKVATAWGRDNGQVKDEAQPNVQPREDELLGSRLDEALAADPNLKATWEGSRNDLESASEYDLALASLAAGRGWTKQEAWDLVVAGRKQRGDDITKVLRKDYAASTLKKAFSGTLDLDAVRPHGIGLMDLWAYLPQSRYIHRPSRELWGPQGVTTVLPSSVVPGGLKATTWLNRNRHVEQMTWAPGEQEVIKDRYIQDGGWFPHSGACVYNMYRPPRLGKGDAANAQPWIDLLLKLYPDEAEDLLDWMAHRAQHPEEKVNHAVVLGGGQGVGKDTLLHPLKKAVGSWNFIEVSPMQITGQFNGFVKSVILRISEAHDLGEMKKFAFYDHTKTLTASPPETIRVNEKHKPEQQIPNLCGVIITTNHADGLYLPLEDRRHLVCWAKAEKEDFADDYWVQLWGWYEKGGVDDVCALLLERDLSAFNPKLPPRRTNAFRSMVETGQPTEQNDFSDALEALGWPDAVTFAQIAEAADGGSEVALWASDSKSSWLIKKRMTANGYELIANEGSDVRWRVAGRKMNIYARSKLHLKEQYAAVQALRAEAAME